MGEIGHNKPPEMIVTAGEVTRDLSGWMAEHPVIQTDVEAKEAKVWLDRAALCWKDLEDERKAQTGPLNEAVKKVNDSFRGPRELLERVEGELRVRMDAFLRQLEVERIAAAERARALAENAERVAREAEQAEQDALGSARAGELDVNVAGVAASADAAFADYQAAEREAAILERATKVKVTGGFTRALSLKAHELIDIDDAPLLFNSVRLTSGLVKELKIAARSYKKATGKWPPGIRVTIERRS